MNKKSLSLILLWVIVMTLGFIIGLTIGSWLETDEDLFPLFLLLGFFISGTLIGLGQWALFETEYKLSWLWIPATAFGIPVGLLIGFPVFYFFPSLIPEALYWLNLVGLALIVGAITGLFQWFFTGKKLVNAKWIFVSAISFLGLAFFYPSTDNPIYFFETEHWALYFVIFGCLFGVFAGTISGVFISNRLTTQHIRVRILNWRASSFLAIIVFGALFSKLFLYDNGYSSPLRFTSYSNSGYYEIYPDTIMDSINRGDNNVLTPASEEIWDRDEPEYGSIHWSQADYLKIADVLSREVWREPLDLSAWQTLYLNLDQDCAYNPRGFYYFEIVYFQNAGVKFWSRQYRVRSIEIISWQGVIRWADTVYSDAILPGWIQVRLNDFHFSADDALALAEGNGGSKARQKADNACRISVWFNNYPPTTGYTRNKWMVNYPSTDFYMWIDPFSGEFRSRNIHE